MKVILFLCFFFSLNTFSSFAAQSIFFSREGGIKNRAVLCSPRNPFPSPFALAPNIFRLFWLERELQLK